MEQPRGRAAAYGRACYSCFKTKCKCVPRLEGDGCERCYRLKRPCRPADVLRRRSEKKPSSSDARIAKVEDTLSQLVCLLQGGNNGGTLDEILQQQQQQQQMLLPRPSDIEAAGRQSPAALTMHTSSFFPEGSGDSSSLSDSNTRPATDDTAFGQDGHNTDANASGASAGWATVDSSRHGSGCDTNMASPVGRLLPPSPPDPLPSSLAQACLDTFRLRMLQHFPVAHLPADCAVQQLQRNRPFLCRAIICVATRSADARRARALELKHELCAQAFHHHHQEQQQTVDLLLGLLVYMAWGWDHLQSYSRREDVSRLMALAISLVGELRPLDRGEAEPAHTMGLLEPRFQDATETTDMEPENARLERYRAILGCFLLGSAVAVYFGQIDAPRWTPEMEEGLAAISRSDPTQYPSDAILDLQVRLQRLGTKAAQIRERAQVPDQPPLATLPPPALTQIRNLMGELQLLRTCIPSEHQQHFGLLAHTYYAELCIIETIHGQPSGPSSSFSSHPPTTTTAGPTRLSCFWQSALAIRSFTSTCMTLSAGADMRGISFMQWSQFSRCLAVLHRLDALREPGWGPGVLRSLVDLPELLASAADKLEQVAAAEASEHQQMSLSAPPAPLDSVFTQLARGLRSFQSTYYGKEGRSSEVPTGETVSKGAAEAAEAAGPRPAGPGPTGTPLITGTDGLDGQGYDMSVMSWLDQFLDDFDEHTTTAF